MTTAPTSLDPPLLQQFVGQVGLLCLNRRSSKNALSRELVSELGAAITRLSEDPSVRAIVLTGSGGAFCSGVDLREAAGAIKNPDEVSARIDGFHAIIRAITEAPKPV